ncbi:hypothetical protein [Streptomyces iranensis]|uniref:hypothetical protein n=1 Tax=Streptomyces iranensis TaxID=576784 RepID=UPI0039B75A01
MAGSRRVLDLAFADDSFDACVPIWFFVRASDGSVQHVWQTAPNNGWEREWKALFDDQVIGDVAVIPDADGRLEAFARAYSYEGALTVLHAPDGRLEVFALFGDGTIRCAWQNVAGNDNDWSAWHSLGVPESSQGG